MQTPDDRSALIPDDDTPMQPIEKSLMQTSSSGVKRRSSAYTDTEKLRIATDFINSGKTLKQYCQETNIPKSSLHDWSKEVREGKLSAETCTGRKRKSKKIKVIGKKPIEYLFEEEDDDEPEEEESKVARYIKSNRNPKRLLNIDRILLHSNPLAHSWFSLFKTMDDNLQLNPKLREFAICLIALKYECEYNIAHHCGPFLTYGGTIDQLSDIKALLKQNAHKFSLMKNNLFSVVEQNVAELCCVINSDRIKARTVISTLNELIGSQAVVELVAVILQYTAVCGFVDVFGVSLEK